MKVKETVCGDMPADLNGYIETEDECYQTSYELDVPMYGFVFEPKSGPVVKAAKLAYYISFFDSAVPKQDHLKTEVIKNGKPVREVQGIVHDRTFQGLVLLAEGENIRMSSKKETSYMIVYVLAVILVAAGVFLILRRKK